MNLSLPELNTTLLNLRKSIYMVDVYANEYFQIVKPDEGQLRKYQHLFSKYSKMYLIYNLLIYFPHLVYNFILNFCHCLFHYHSTFYAKNMSTPHSDFLIFSHLTKDNIDSSDDRFYGFIPRYLEIHGFPTSTFFSNHVRIRYSKLVKTASWLGKVNPILSPKSVQIFVFMRICAKTLKTSLEIFIKGISGRNYSKEERLMLLEASRFQTNRTTLAVLFLLHHLIFAINKTGASRVLLSFEGHTYELYFAKMIRAYFPAIEINFYQYAPVVPMQFGLFHNLKAFPDNCQIWTSGEITKGIMIDAARNTKTKVRVLGSNKYLGFVNSKQYFPKDREVIKKKTILFAPEGNLHQSKEFLKLANLCCQKFPNLRFILRLHPSLHKSVQCGLTHDNFSISAEDLVTDLEQSRICIFRSSAVGIQSEFFGVIPVHYQESQSLRLNPMEQYTNNCVSVHSVNELFDLLENEFQSKAVKHNPLGIAQKRTSEYFAELAPEKLVK